LIISLNLRDVFSIAVQSKQGGSLLPASAGKPTEVDLREQLNFAKRMRQELEKARLLHELIRKREKLKQIQVNNLIQHITPLCKSVEKLGQINLITSLLAFVSTNFVSFVLLVVFFFVFLTSLLLLGLEY